MEFDIKMEYDVRFTCRTCLKKTEDGMSIFDIPLNSSTRFVDMLASINNDISMLDLKYFPIKLCSSCVKILLTSWKFIEMCRTSEKILQKYFTDIKVEQSNVTFHNIKQEFNEDDSTDAECVESDIECDDKEKLNTECGKEKEKSDGICNDDKKFRAKKTNHKTTNADIKSHCPVCNRIFDRELNLKKHMKEGHPGCTEEIVYNCESCQKRFKRKTDLVVHRRIHTGEKPFQCQICLRAFTQSGSLIEHSRVHSARNPLVCPICNKILASRSSFQRHRLVHSKEKLFACEICGKTFTLSVTLRHHRAVHTEERPHFCSICNKGFKHKHALRVHLISHSEKHLVCEHCGKKFSTKHNVRLHIQKLHSENAGECPVCFKIMPNLKEHMFIHNGEKPYQCKICNLAFRQKKSLSQHLNAHKNAGKYKCEVDGCKKAYPQINMLTFHVNKIHTKKATHTCSVCSKEFYRGSDLSRHLNLAHIETMH